MENFHQTLVSEMQKLRAIRPLVHHITNFVAAPLTANCLLAIGSSPLMAHESEELSEIINISSALVLNIGTLDKNQVEQMKKAIELANKKGIPVILDPVGAGASKLRTQVSLELLTEAEIVILKANASEIMALKGEQIQSKGVDSTAGSEQAVNAAQFLLEEHNCKAVVVTGATDIVFSPSGHSKHFNGDPMMEQVTGTGCALGGVIGSFCAINDNYTQATQVAVSLFTLAGELAASEAKGPGSFSVQFLDKLSQLEPVEISKLLRVEPF